MNKSRLPLVMIIVALVLAAAFAVVVSRETIGAPSTSAAAPAGFGDLHAYEAQSAQPLTGAASLTRPGFGDLHAYEAQSAQPQTGAASLTRPGFGDLHRFEAQESSH